MSRVREIRWRRAGAAPAAVAVAVALTVLGGCGGGGGGGGTTRTVTGGTVDVNAFDPYRFDVKTIQAPPGDLVVTLHEHGSQQHTFTVPALHFEIKVTPDKPEATGTLALEPGKTYSFKCSFDGHAAAGMTGKIVVTG